MKKFNKYLNEYHTLLQTIKMDEIYEGYRLYLTRVESCSTGQVHFQISSNEFSQPTHYETLQGAVDYIKEWQIELA